MRDTFRRFKPKHILEWGTGDSTKLMHKLCPDAQIVSIEHQTKYYIKWKLLLYGYRDKVILVKRDLKHYANPHLPERYFDFIFVDGFKPLRVKCMRTSLKLLKDKGLLMLHDSDDDRFKKGIKLFKKIKELDRTILLSKK